MASKTAAVSVGTSATRLDTQADADSRADQNVTLQVIGAGTVYVGGSDVTTATGIQLVTGAIADLQLPAGSALYGIVGSGTSEVRVMQVGV